MNTRIAVSLLALTLAGSALQAQAGGPNASLIGELSSALKVPHEQAEAAAGAIFAAAKSNMSQKHWSLVTDAIHGVPELINTVPHRPDSLPPMAAAPVDSGSRGVSSMTGAFTRLGLDPSQVPTAAKIVSDYVNRNAGPDTGKKFADALH